MSEFTQGMLFASLADGFLPVLVDATAKTSVIVLLAGLTATLLYRSSAAARHLVWAVAFLAFLLLPILSLTIPKWRVLPGWLGTGDFTSGADRVGARSLQGPGSPVPIDAGPRDSSPRLATSAATLQADPTESMAASSPIQPATTSWSWDSRPLSRLVLGVWLIGFGLLLVRTACSRFGLRRLLRSADAVDAGPVGDEIRDACRRFEIGRPVNAYLSSQRGTPMTWGLLRTDLLLPAEATGWGEQRLRSVVLHELAHVKRRDTITHVLTQLICALYWFHPLVWLAARRLRIESERACDDLVLRSDVRASDYAEDLLSILVKPPIPCTVLAIARPSELEVRLRAILDERIDRRSITTGILAWPWWSVSVARRRWPCSRPRIGLQQSRQDLRPRSRRLPLPHRSRPGGPSPG